jgi:hypothetical protein
MTNGVADGDYPTFKEGSPAGSANPRLIRAQRSATFGWVSYSGFETLTGRNSLSTAGELMLRLHGLDRPARFYKYTTCFCDD